ncbi:MULTISPECIES: polyribonucleotide nucleotidyltransferase [Candidatus Ichthyocystis]|uniref:polyribonucleotide nucleotidyltransferase n=1 Tax=Candidatus Ichthyocystis TaxID=2929841 RepID=UPI000B19E1A5|nr:MULTISPECIES: polyribonucleotide nucleotidyltransferase [Ichthyocystis]
MLKRVVKEFQYGDHKVRLETGMIARQADGAVVVNIEDTIVLATVVAKKELSAEQGFFPLTVDYIEKSYAAGKIPGGFFKREGRSAERETLVARLIDRPLRPLFPKSFFNEVQVVLTVLSVNQEIDPDVPAMIAASAAVTLSGIPFSGPIAAARVGYVDGKFVLNPSISIRRNSRLDLIVSGTSSAILMVESDADMLSEEIMLEAVMFGHREQQVVIKSICELANEVGNQVWDWVEPEDDLKLKEDVEKIARKSLENAYRIRDKKARNLAIDKSFSDVLEKLLPEGHKESLLKSVFFILEYSIVRTAILSGEPRIDGRDTRTVRPLDIKTSILPRAHGSALFTRGETQALAVTTLGTESDAQVVDGLVGDTRESFILHYNMPGYATGEVGRMGAPKRREIGHGRLARRALAAVVPSKKDFPYTIRLVSEITESNGSSSMASVCAGCLSLMDAGVPLASHVAGVAMGLIKEGNCFAILTDIIADEDHLGDMDFKVAGTELGITALQMDIKIDGITEEIMHIALLQAKEGRLHILSAMKNALSSARMDLSAFAPRISCIHINPEKIHLLIGKGGGTIKNLTEETRTSIDIKDDGTVSVASSDLSCVEEAVRRIQILTAEIVVGKTYDGKVSRVLDFGVIVDILPGRDGLLHISQMVRDKSQKISDIYSEGQIISVKVIGLDDRGRPRLSLKL